jgi:hypothetical protein
MLKRATAGGFSYTQIVAGLKFKMVISIFSANSLKGI